MHDSTANALPQIDKGAALTLVTELMAIPGKSCQEGQIVERIRLSLDQAGIPASAVTTDAVHRKSPAGGEVGNLIVRLSGTVRGDRRMLMAHVDTVPLCVGSKPVRRGPVIVSRDPKTALGADDRAGACIVLTALLEIVRQQLPHPPLTLFWPVQEEIGLYGARLVNVSKLGKPKLCFNFDSSGPEFAITGATGDYNIEVEIEGIASHAGVHPEKGVSAIAIASHAIADLNENGWHGLVIKGKNTGTSNVGFIHAGEATNVVTPNLTLRAEVRSHDPKFRRRLLDEFRKAFERAARRVKNDSGKCGKVRFESELKYESFRLADDEPCVTTALAAIRAVGLDAHSHCERRARWELDDRARFADSDDWVRTAKPAYGRRVPQCGGIPPSLSNWPAARVRRGLTIDRHLHRRSVRSFPIRLPDRYIAGVGGANNIFHKRLVFSTPVSSATINRCFCRVSPVCVKASEMQVPTLGLEESWQTLRSRIDVRLKEYLRLDSDCPPSLRESMGYSLLAGGKRLRPVLVLLACEACDGDVEAALPAACAVEMIHTYSLIHDDLPAMDDDVLRRGRPTNHVQFGEAQAILAGDGLLTLAFEILARDVKPAETAAACCVDLASAAGPCGMVAGQVADLESELAGDATLEQLEAVHRRKTGRLLSSSLTMGGRIAGANAEMLGALESYGTSVGLAFQIADDLLDIKGQRDKLGKSVGKDAAQGKLTYPALLGVETSRQMAAELIDKACRSISAFGVQGQRLEALAHFVLQRDH